jgi:hypothetical protein
LLVSPVDRRRSRICCLSICIMRSSASDNQVAYHSGEGGGR